MDKITAYKKSKRAERALRFFAPIVFWLCVAVSVICLFFAIKNSIGNIGSMLDLLDGKKYSGEEIAQNYELLVEKYGEWTVGTFKGAPITFVNIKQVVFNGFAVMNAVMSVTFALAALLLGKLIMPAMKKHLTEKNEDLVNITILENDRKAKS